jgi:hypothetical protein
MSAEAKARIDRWTLIVTLAINLLLFAYSYGTFAQRIAGVESNIQDIKVDIHELRAQSLAERK